MLDHSRRVSRFRGAFLGTFWKLRESLFVQIHMWLPNRWIQHNLMALTNSAGCAHHIMKKAVMSTPKGPSNGIVYTLGAKIPTIMVLGPFEQLMEDHPHYGFG